MKISGIYKIQSVIKPSRIYIGSAINIQKRIKSHFDDLKEGQHANFKLQRHYNKYGRGDLVASILEACDKEDLIQHEQFFIDSYNPWFNICKKAGSKFGVKCSDKTRKKIGISNRGKQSFLGKHHTDKTKQLMSEIKKALPVSEALIKKQMEPLRGENHPGFGKHLSEEHKRKLSDIRKLRVGIKSPNYGRIMSEAQKFKLSKAKKGKKLNLSEETRIRMIEFRKGNQYALGNKLSEETRRKMSESHKGKPKSAEHKAALKYAAMLRKIKISA